MTPIDQLKSVLCDPEGKCCISGSDEDRAIVDRALKALAEQPAQQEPVGEVSGHDWSTGLLYRDLEPGAPLYATPQAQPAQVEVCCGDYGKCMKPCTPRGKWLAKQPAPAQDRETKEVVINNMGKPFIVRAYVTPQAQENNT